MSDFIGVALLIFGAFVAAAGVWLIATGGDVAVGVIAIIVGVLGDLMIGSELLQDWG